MEYLLYFDGYETMTDKVPLLPLDVVSRVSYLDVMRLKNMYNEIIQDLSGHFINAKINPPASVTQIRELKEIFPEVNEEIILFYECCNGFSVTDDVYGVIYSIEEIIYSYPVIMDSEEYPLIKNLCPIRDDGCGDYDCIMISKEIWNGCVVFWDHEIYDFPSYILGGSFISYIEILKEYLIECFEPDGVMKPEYVEEIKEFPWPFDNSWMIKRDKKAKELLKNQEFRTLLKEQDH